MTSLLSGVGALGRHRYSIEPPVRAEAGDVSAAPSSTATMTGAASEATAQDDDPAATHVLPAEEPHVSRARELDEAHWPAEPAARLVAGDPTTFRARLETLLESDPETLRQARALLDEPDASLRSRNLALLREAFGVE